MQEPFHLSADHRDPAGIRGRGEARRALSAAQRVADDVRRMAGRVRRNDRVGSERLKSLEDESRRLKELLAEALLDNKALQGLSAKNG